MRIFVGGLGWSVTADDLRKTFSSLGEVDSVDIVRTKGRTFAYFDFLPSSDKALAKFFSMYNGCVWKGGRLRLEKAKEHYLLRLRREWAEDAELASSAPSYNVDAAENMLSSEKPKKVSKEEKLQLRIFFPKLKKVKSVPFSGTGKHKYSFQRIEVPSLPINFCDCEEHSVPSHTAKEKPFCDLETESGGINEGELNMMRSVMGKLFEQENCLKAACSEAGLAKEGDNSINSVDDLLIDENEADSVTDDDNLIINVVAGGNDKIAVLGSWKQEAIMTNQESIFNEPKTSKDRPARKMHESQKKSIPSSKKRKSPFTEESDGNENVSAIPERKGSLQTHLNESETHLEAQATKPVSGTPRPTSNLSWSQKSAWRDLVGEKGKTPFHISHIMPSIVSAKEEQPRSDGPNMPYSTNRKNQNLVKHVNLESQLGQPKELKELAEAPPPKPNAVVNKLAGGDLWLQKSSWTQLVGDNSRSFSISQILPDVTSEKQELLQPHDMDAANSTGNKQHSLFKSERSASTDSTRDNSNALGVAYKDLLTAPCSSNVVAMAQKDQDPAGLDVEQTNAEKKLQTVRKNNEVSAPTLEKKHLAAQTFAGDTGIGETCPFMRSATSMREWMKTKAALSGSLKKKGNER